MPYATIQVPGFDHEVEYHASGNGAYDDPVIIEWWVLGCDGPANDEIAASLPQETIDLIEAQLHELVADYDDYCDDY